MHGLRARTSIRGGVPVCVSWYVINQKTVITYKDRAMASSHAPLPFSMCASLLLSCLPRYSLPPTPCIRGVLPTLAPSVGPRLRC